MIKFKQLTFNFRIMLIYMVSAASNYDKYTYAMYLV